jgi:hypothetical protein
MSTTPPITAWVPKISADPKPDEIHRLFTLAFQKLGNHATAFGIQQANINSIKAGVSNTIIQGGGSGGGGSITPATPGGIPVNNQSGSTSYATASTDDGALIVLSNASPIAVTLTSQSPPWSCFIANQSALGGGTATMTPASGTINGSATLVLLPSYFALVAFDGTNWFAATLPIVPVSFGPISHEFLTAYNAATGSLSAAQPEFTDISGVASPAQLPTPTSSTLGGVESSGPITHQWVNQIDTSGTPHLSQPAFGDVSGSAATGQIGTGTPSAGRYVDGGTGAWTVLPSPTLPATIAPVAGEFLTGYNATTGEFSQATPTGLSVTIVTAALTALGTQGSMQFVNGILVNSVPAT